MNAFEQQPLDFNVGLEPGPDGALQPSVTIALAGELGSPLVDFVEVFGAGWRRLPSRGVDLDADPTGSGDVFGPWYVAGEPYQLALRPHRDGVELGLPVGEWAGPGSLHWEIHHRQHVAAGPDHAEAAQAAIAELLRTRHRTFRYCRYCRNHTPPEELATPETCYGCASEWLGLVH